MSQISKPSQQSQGDDPKHSYRNVLALIIKATRSQDLKRDDQATLNLLYEAASFTKSWVRGVEKELAGHGLLEDRNKTVNPHTHSSRRLLATPLLALLRGNTGGRSHPRRIGVLAEMHSILGSHLASVEAHVSELEGLLEGNKGNRRRRRKRSKHGDGAEPSERAVEPWELLKGNSASPDGLPASKESSYIPSKAHGLPQEEHTGSNASERPSTYQVQGQSSSTSLKPKPESSRKGGLSGPASKRSHQSKRSPGHSSTRGLLDSGASDINASHGSASNKSQGVRSEALQQESGRGSSRQGKDHSPKTERASRGRSRTDKGSRSRLCAGQPQLSTPGSHHQPDGGRNASVESKAVSRKSHKESGKGHLESQQGTSKTSSIRPAAEVDAAELDMPEQLKKKKSPESHERQQPSDASQQSVISNGIGDNNVPSDADLDGVKCPNMPKKCHHPPSQASGCPSRAWSCEVVPDENGGVKLDPEHVHQKAGGCS